MPGVTVLLYHLTSVKLQLAGGHPNHILQDILVDLVIYFKMASDSGHETAKQAKYMMSQ